MQVKQPNTNQLIDAAKTMTTMEIGLLADDVVDAVNVAKDKSLVIDFYGDGFKLINSSGELIATLDVHDVSQSGVERKIKQAIEHKKACLVEEHSDYVELGVSYYGVYGVNIPWEALALTIIVKLPDGAVYDKSSELVIINDTAYKFYTVGDKPALKVVDEDIDQQPTILQEVSVDL